MRGFLSKVGAAALVCFSFLAGVPSTQAGDSYSYLANPTGFAADTSNPLDGVGDTAGPLGLALDMFRNASDASSSAVQDRRAILEVYLPSLPGGLALAAATLEFEVYTYNSLQPVSIFLYGGDGLITPADYGRTDLLAFSGVIDDPTPYIDVTSEVQTILNSGSQWVGVLIGMTAEDQAFSIYNTGYGPIEPSLKIKVVPEPATLTLAGLLVLLTFARRRRS